MCCLIHFSGNVHLQKAPVTAGLENMPGSQSFNYRRKYHLFKQNFLSAHIWKNTYYLILFNKNFGKYLEPRKNFPRFAWLKPQENIGWV